MSNFHDVSMIVLPNMSLSSRALHVSHSQCFMHLFIFRLKSLPVELSPSRPDVLCLRLESKTTSPRTKRLKRLKRPKRPKRLSPRRMWWMSMKKSFQRHPLPRRCTTGVTSRRLRSRPKARRQVGWRICLGKKIRFWSQFDQNPTKGPSEQFSIISPF